MDGLRQRLIVDLLVWRAGRTRSCVTTVVAVLSACGQDLASYFRLIYTCESS